jgi:hypothetical protein
MFSGWWPDKTVKKLLHWFGRAGIFAALLRKEIFLRELDSGCAAE